MITLHMIFWSKMVIRWTSVCRQMPTMLNAQNLPQKLCFYIFFFSKNARKITLLKQEYRWNYFWQKLNLKIINNQAMDFRKKIWYWTELYADCIYDIKITLKCTCKNICIIQISSHYKIKRISHAFLHL